MSRLAIFDIDGTLTDTNGVDDECYRLTIAEALELEPAAVDWSAALHVTDGGILDWLCTLHERPRRSPGEIAAARNRLAQRLALVLAQHPERFREIAGAADAVRHLEENGWAIAVATGGWGPSARLKLRAAGIGVADAVIACADDATARDDIVALAKARAEAHYGRTFSRVVSIGDGPWDVGAAASLGLPFIGIATGEREAELTSAGVGTVLADYSDLAAFMRSLETASPPRLAPARSLRP